jgi:clan AA aspartic protease (TIGR02281 family)
MHRAVRLLVVVACLFAASAFSAEPLFSPRPDITPVALQKRDAGTFYVAGAIEGYGELEMLVDTGSSLLVINEKILAVLEAEGAAEFSYDLRGVMADGSQRVIPIYRLAGLRIGEDCWIHDVDAAVFPSSSRPILGMNILAKLSPFTFSAEPPQLALNSCQAMRLPAELTVTQASPPDALAQ